MTIMDMKILIVVLVAAVVLMLIVWSFSQGRYGGLRPSREATDAFESFRVNPAMAYYPRGSDDGPNAIIGIDRMRELESDLWTRRDLNADRMRQLVVNMRSRAMDQFLQGFDILDDRGAKVGEWYSLPGISITVWLKGTDRISISTPPADIYRDRSEK